MNFDGVGDEVEDDLLQSLRIGDDADRRIAGRVKERNALGRHLRSDERFDAGKRFAVNVTRSDNLASEPRCHEERRGEHLADRTRAFLDSVDWWVRRKA